MASNFQQQLRWFGLGNLTARSPADLAVSLIRCTPVALSATYAAHPDLWDILASWPEGQGSDVLGNDWKLAPLNEEDVNCELSARAVRELLAPIYAQIRDRGDELHKDISKGGSLASAAIEGSVVAQDQNAGRNCHTYLRMHVLDRLMATVFSGSGLAEPSVVPSQVDHGLSKHISADDKRVAKDYGTGITKWKETLTKFCSNWESQLEKLSTGNNAIDPTDNPAESLLRASSDANDKKTYATNEMNLYDLAVALQALSSVSNQHVSHELQLIFITVQSTY